MYMDPAIPYLAGIAAAIFTVGLVSRWLHQPYVVGYILAGMALGPHGLKVITDHDTMSKMGAIGVLLLLFFCGVDIPLRRLVVHWRIPMMGMLLQVLVSVACVSLLGAMLGWPIQRSVLLGFVISLSSTAVILKVLQDRGEADQPLALDVIGLSLVQDLALVPMMIVLGLLSGDPLKPHVLTLQIVGGIGIFVFLVWVTKRSELVLPGARIMSVDREMQVFAALMICFGTALVTGLFGLSAALGAFVGGVVIAASRQTQWVRQSLDPFRVVFVGLFFVSMGMLIDLKFLIQHWAMLTALVLAALWINTLINAVVLRLLGQGWRNSIYAGAMLAQIGEFSFVLAAVGLSAGIIGPFGYQTTLAVICLTMLVSPFWITAFRALTGSRHRPNASGGGSP